MPYRVTGKSWGLGGMVRMLPGVIKTIMVGLSQAGLQQLATVAYYIVILYFFTYIPCCVPGSTKNSPGGQCK